MVNRALFWIYVIYCFEVGIFLIVFPWSGLWDANSLLSYVPTLNPLILSDYFRGAVSGLGFANILLGIREVAYSQRVAPRAEVDPPDPLRDH